MHGRLIPGRGTPSLGHRCPCHASGMRILPGYQLATMPCLHHRLASSLNIFLMAKPCAYYLRMCVLFFLFLHTLHLSFAMKHYITPYITACHVCIYRIIRLFHIVFLIVVNKSCYLNINIEYDA